MNTIFPDSTVFFTGKKALILLKEFITKSINPDKIFIITDNNVEKYCLNTIKKIFKNSYKPEILTIPDNEINKNIATCEILWEKLAEKGASRKSLIINMGGGLVSDIGGFIAATFKRGLKYINIPTTLLAQIDASIGGKTSIDFKGIKNLIGVFSFPEAILIYPDFINTISEQQKKSGFAEMVKIALACDRSFWQHIYETKYENITNWSILINRAIAIKLQVVGADPFETGFRKVLNFGHTIGHAFESFSLLNNSRPLLHGEAVAMGMICETILSKKITGLKPEETDEIINYLLSNFPYFKISKDNISALLKLTYYDKKNESEELKFTLLTSPGRAIIGQKVSPEEVEQCLEEYILLNNN
ncbi:MAG TPA: 3-dehydroquinate synthase [Bacteroidales bacterium]|nr:3-dehydroquinate synthase [Bacteroidales bacterium]